MTDAYLRDVQYYLPEAVTTNDDLVVQNPTWDASKIFAKTGIRQRHVASAEQTASDLAFRAADKLLANSGTDPATIDALIFCTQSPDYFLPTSACLLQHRLGLPSACAAFDFNLGCSGFTYGLWLARALIASQSAGRVLLLVGDTYSRYCRADDLTTVTIFGDGAGAALIDSTPEGAIGRIGLSVVGTDGRGGENLIVRAGCARQPLPAAAIATDHPAEKQPAARACLEMNGPEIFSFTLTAVQNAIEQLLARTSWRWDDVDLFLLHQANGFMLEQLRRKMNLPRHKMPIDLAEQGNTVSATLPILMRNMLDRDAMPAGSKCVLAGFGVGYSWAVTAFETL